MNKKLFFAGFALLAAVSFTSCNSDNPIDVTDPNGVRPTVSSHYVGNGADWTATVKDYAELKAFAAADAADIAKQIKEKKTIDIQINLNNYELKADDGLNGDGVIKVPAFWDNGTNKKVVNINVTGTFKNADFERAAAIKDGAGAKAFPVKIDVDNLKGTEVNFTFADQKFDLYIQTELARSTFSGDFTIGYMFAKAAEKNSNLELKSGTVEGVDIESTGDFRGQFDGVWAKAPVVAGFDPYIYADGTGLYGDFWNPTGGTAGTGAREAGTTIPGASNIFVEKDVEIQTRYWNGAANVIYPLGKVKFVQKKNDAVDVAIDWGHTYAIESIEGTNTNDCDVYVSANALDDVAAVSKVTIKGTPTLKKDVFTDVVFANTITFDSKNITTIDKVTFNNINVIVSADNTAFDFGGVTFYNAAVMSGINVGNIDSYYTYTYYQWEISDTNPANGKWVAYDGQAKNQYQYNKDKAEILYSDRDVRVTPAGVLDYTYYGDCSYPSLDAATHLIKIATFHPENVAQVIPDGTTFTFDKDCKFWDNILGKVDGSDYGLNQLFGHKDDSKDCWYDVTFGGKAYNWKRVNYKQATGDVIYWDLVPPTVAE